MTLRRIILLLLMLQAAILDAHFGFSHGMAPMAILMIEGFDNIPGNNALLIGKGWSGTMSSATGRFDGLAGQFLTTTTTRAHAITSSATLVAGFALQTNNVTTALDYFIFTSGATLTCRVGISAAGFLTVRNSGGTTIATGTTPIGVSAWNYIEVKCFVNAGTPASGTVEVHLNGVVEIASTAGNFGSANMDGIRIGTTSAAPVVNYDDMYVLDTTGSAPRNTFLGDVRVETIYPNADGAHLQWTPTGGGAHYTQVNETPPDLDTTYVSDGTPGDLDTYGFTDIDGGATVYGVQLNMVARKDDAATRQIANVIRQAGSDNVGTTVTLSASYQVYLQLFNQDPTSSDWTPTTLNADEFGVKEIA